MFVSEPEALATVRIENPSLTLPARTDCGCDLRRPHAGRALSCSAPNRLASAIDLLTRFGHMPLPPYVRKGRADGRRHRTLSDRLRPPAGRRRRADRRVALHRRASSTRLRDRGIATTTLTLHVGLGTFQPLQSDDPTKHVMHREWCELPAAAADAVNACRARGGRVVAVGTTAVRTLESAAGRTSGGPLAPWSGETDLFIYPPYNFRVVDALVTNFHLPRTSLLLLVGAFAGEDLLRRAYEDAIARPLPLLQLRRRHADPVNLCRSKVRLLTADADRGRNRVPGRVAAAAPRSTAGSWGRAAVLHTTHRSRWPYHVRGQPRHHSRNRPGGTRRARSCTAGRSKSGTAANCDGN